MSIKILKTVNIIVFIKFVCRNFKSTCIKANILLYFCILNITFTCTQMKINHVAQSAIYTNRIQHFHSVISRCRAFYFWSLLLYSYLVGKHLVGAILSVVSESCPYCFYDFQKYFQRHMLFFDHTCKFNVCYLSRNMSINLCMRLVN